MKEIVGENFVVQNQKQPVGLCETCRKKYFSSASIEAKIKFTLPPYLYTIVLSNDNVNLPCKCSICQKVRGKDLSLNLLQNQTPHQGGRPKIPESEKKQKSKVSPPSACSNCLCLKGPDHDHKKCNEVTKIKNVVDLAVVEGNVTK